MLDHKTLSMVRNVIGVIGNVISIFLFTSPVPTFVKICKSVDEFKVDPYLATIMNCSLGVLYGLPSVHPNSILVVTTNAIGLAIELVYVSVFLVYADHKARVKVILWIAIEVAFLSIVATCTLTLFEGSDKRSRVVGIASVIFGLLMYISPLTIMGKVMKTKSVKYMPLSLSLSNLANGMIWTIYALMPLDYFIIIPNGVGAVSGAVQLALYLYYQNEDKPTHLQISPDNDNKTNCNNSNTKHTVIYV